MPLHDRDETALATVLGLLFGLSPLERWALTRMATHDCVSTKELRAVLTGRARSAIGVFIYNLRTKLHPHGIEIATIHGGGYGLTADARMKIRDLLGRHDAEILPIAKTEVCAPP